MKIIRNGFSSRNRNIGLVSLPKNLKKLWPDPPKNYFSVSYNETFWFPENIATKLQEFNLQKHERILDIGAFKNEMVEMLQTNGYCNAVGIDVNSKILRSKYGMKINFRDLRLNEKYRMICFNQVLCHFPGGIYNKQLQPSLQLFADKIYLHLLPKGYLIFCDSEDNVPKFKECLLNIGFKQIYDHDQYLHVFQKD
jgi:hypothetical protein